MKAVRMRMRGPSPLFSIERYRRAALRQLPGMIRTYVEGGADDLVTLHENEASFQRRRLRQRGLSGLVAPDFSCSFAGERLAMPVALSPVGVCGLLHHGGDIAVARGAERVGSRATLSTASSHRLEEVMDATEARHWFQLYVTDRALAEHLIDRAQAAGYTSLFLTIDAAIRGNREGERASGLGVPLDLTPRGCFDLALHPKWVLRTAMRGRVMPVHMTDWAAHLAASGAQPARQPYALGKQDLAWIRDRWKGRFYIKGILDPDDAEYLVSTGLIDGIVVSNHGGRQLDRVPASLDSLDAIAQRVAGRTELYVDGGIRRGTDVITALCLGASGVFIGRPYLYGLAVAGEDGVADILKILAEELGRALALMGCPRIDQLDRSWLVPLPGPPST